MCNFPKSLPLAAPRRMASMAGAFAVGGELAPAWSDQTSTGAGMRDRVRGWQQAALSYISLRAL